MAGIILKIYEFIREDEKPPFGISHYIATLANLITD